MTDRINVQNEISALNWQGTSDDAVKWVQLQYENRFYPFTQWQYYLFHSDITDLSKNIKDLYDTIACNIIID